MPLPQFRTLDGDLVALRWTRLKPASEVQAVVPPRAEPRWRNGLVFGPERMKEIGAGFDRRTVFVRPVIADDGMYQVMGRTIRGRPQTGVAFKYEPDRAWTPADLGHAEAQAVAILKAHDFPVDYEWPKPGAWAWSGEDDLWWAEAPEEGGQTGGRSARS